MEDTANQTILMRNCRFLQKAASDDEVIICLFLNHPTPFPAQHSNKRSHLDQETNEFVNLIQIHAALSLTTCKFTRHSGRNIKIMIAVLEVFQLHAGFQRVVSLVHVRVKCSVCALPDLG